MCFDNGLSRQARDNDHLPRQARDKRKVKLTKKLPFFDVPLAVAERRPRSDQAAKDFPVRFDRAAANAARAVERGRGVTCAQPTLARVHLRELQENTSLF